MCALCASCAALVAIVVGDETRHLCREHAAKLGDRVASGFVDMAELMALPALDRRLRPQRRLGDRRMFPPRPELRRYNGGRRDGDPPL